MPTWLRYWRTIKRVKRNWGASAWVNCEKLAPGGGLFFGALIDYPGSRRRRSSLIAYLRP